MGGPLIGWALVNILVKMHILFCVTCLIRRFSDVGADSMELRSPQDLGFQSE